MTRMTRIENAASYLLKTVSTNLTLMHWAMLMIKTWISICLRVVYLTFLYVHSVIKSEDIARYINLQNELCARFVVIFFPSISISPDASFLYKFSRLYHAKTYFTSRWRERHHHYWGSSPDIWVLCSSAIDVFQKAVSHPQLPIRTCPRAHPHLMNSKNAPPDLRCANPSQRHQKHLNTCMPT
jgi:hypothetical protein